METDRDCNAIRSASRVLWPDRTTKFVNELSLRTPTRASIWHTTSGNTKGNLLGAWRRPIRRELPHHSPRRVVDLTGGRSWTFLRPREELPRATEHEDVDESTSSYATPTCFNGGGQTVPPPPKCLQEVGRFLRIPEDASGVDEQRQTPPYQRVRPDNAPRSAMAH